MAYPPMNRVIAALSLSGVLYLYGLWRLNIAPTPLRMTPVTFWMVSC